MDFFLVVVIMCCVFVTKSSNAHGWFKEEVKEDDTLELGVNSTGPYHQHSAETGSRRTIVAPTDGCYKQFFVGERPPTGLRPPGSGNIKHICQQLEAFNDITYYATMFDQHIGIAVYVAYVVPFDEAQFVGTFPRISKWLQDPDINNLRQGSDNIYHNSGRVNIHKGHLVPAATYSFDCIAMVSTFRYTNAVPQYAAFNTGPWGRYEGKVRELAGICRLNQGDLYLITGTSEAELVPGAPPQRRALNYFPNNVQGGGNIAIPNSMWTAGCCIHRNSRRAVGGFAAIGNNVQVGSAMHQKTVNELQDILAIGVGGGVAINLFPGNDGCSNNLNQFRYDALAVHHGWSKSVALR